MSWHALPGTKNHCLKRAEIDKQISDGDDNERARVYCQTSSITADIQAEFYLNSIGNPWKIL
jgi:hypothetical protein